MKDIEHERRDWLIIIIILVFGLLCVFVAGEWALHFAPRWTLNADMGSELNPNSNYLTPRPSEFVEPIDSSILTQPVWINVFLTPGASISTRIHSTSTPTPLPTSSSVALTVTRLSTGTATNTLVYLLPTRTPTSNLAYTKTSTPKAAPTATPTSTASTIAINTATRTSTATTTNTATRTATPTGTATRTSTSTNTATATNTSTVTATATNTPTATTTGTATNTSVPSADLRITKTDNTLYYEDGGATTYTIVVSNNGPANVSNATVTDNFPGQVLSATWTCAGTGTTCTASGSGNINDSINLPSGSSVTYTVNASIGSASGDMVNTATVSSSIVDPVTSNNSATDTDQLAFPLPYGNIGTAPDGSSQNIPTSSYLVLISAQTLNIGSGQSLVYYLPSNFQIDHVILQIGDGNNWYTVFNWGDGSPDSNTNIPVPLPPPNPTTCAGEPDNCVIDSSFLYNSTGVTISLDSAGVPPGNYTYIRIISPSDSGDGVDVDAIAILP